MTNLQVLEKLRARLLKKFASLDAESESRGYDWETAREFDLQADGVALSVELLDELVKELED